MDHAQELSPAHAQKIAPATNTIMRLFSLVNYALRPWQAV